MKVKVTKKHIENVLSRIMKGENIKSACASEGIKYGSFNYYKNKFLSQNQKSPSKSKASGNLTELEALDLLHEKLNIKLESFDNEIALYRKEIKEIEDVIKVTREQHEAIALEIRKVESVKASLSEFISELAA